MVINLTSAAVILWSGMLIIAGTLLVLSSQVRHLVELLENNRLAAPSPAPAAARRVRTTPNPMTAGRPRNVGPRIEVLSSRAARRYAPLHEPA